MSTEFVIGTLVSVIGALFMALGALAVHWIRDGFSRNDKEHGEIKEVVHSVRDRVDHVILYHDNIPKFEGEE